MAISPAKLQKAVTEHVANGFNSTKTYLAVNPKANYNTAHTNGSRFTTKYNIDNKAIAILNRRKATSEEGVLESLEDDLNATKVIPNDKPLIYVRDNTTILETKKTLLKLYGHLRNSDGDSKGGSTVNIKIDNITVNNLNKAIEKLDSIANVSDGQTGEITDAEILSD